MVVARGEIVPDSDINRLTTDNVQVRIVRDFEFACSRIEIHTTGAVAAHEVRYATVNEPGDVKIGRNRGRFRAER